jgi:hypothetical protein
MGGGTVAMERAELERRAITRALAMGGASCVTRLKFGSYAVESASRPGTVHRVSVVGQTYLCSCEAGLAGRPCWHAGAVYVAKIQVGGGRVTGPASPGFPAASERPGTLAPAA